MKTEQVKPIIEESFHLTIKEEAQDEEIMPDQIEINEEDFGEINFDYSRSKSDWMKYHPSEVQCYKCGDVVLMEEIELHLMQIHDCQIKEDYGPMRAKHCNLCGRAYDKKHKCLSAKNNNGNNDTKKKRACRKCGKKYSSESGMRVHMKRVSNVIWFTY